MASLFTDFISAVEKIGKGVANLREIPADQRAHYLDVIGETYTLLNAALNLVIIRLGDVLLSENDADFSRAVRGLDNFNEWLGLERDLRMCSNLRAADREMEGLWEKWIGKMALKDADEVRFRIKSLLSQGEAGLASYIASNLAQLGHLADQIDGTPESIRQAREQIRDFRKGLMDERLQIMNSELELRNSI